MICNKRTVINEGQIIDNRIKISIVIPTYNERDNVKILLESLIINLKNTVKYEIIIVDDNSPDGTGKIVDDLSRYNKHINVVHRPAKMGISSAIIDGIKISKGKYILISDGDLQHSTKFIKILVNEIEKGYDLVIASRYVKEAKIEGWTLIRKIISLGATSLAHLLFPETRKINDPLSGYFIFEKNKIKNLKLSRIGWKILLELLIKAQFAAIKEIPYNFKTRIKGKSKMGVFEYFDYLKLLLMLQINR